jgi:hypothetical protein
MPASSTPRSTGTPRPLELLAEDVLGLGMREKQQERVCGVGDAGIVQGC